MTASLSGAVALFAAPLSQAARVVEALRQKAEEDPSILRGGAGTPASQPTEDTADAAGDQPAEAPVAEAPAPEAEAAAAPPAG